MSVLSEFGTYLTEARRLRKAYPRSFDVRDLVRFFPDWHNSLKPLASPLADERPWITFAAIRFLEKALNKQMRIYEYGSGGSTVFFAKRAGEVVSVEHDPDWGRRVMESMKRGGYKNWRIVLIEPTLNATSINGDPSDSNSYVSGGDNFRGRSFKDYASSIDQYPDRHFDVVLIDGRARPSCFKHAVPKVKKHGYVVWDNTDRPYYFPAMKSVPKTFRFLDFPGPSPYVDFFTRTSVWCNGTP
jgi:hypothetical protein